MPFPDVSEQLGAEKQALVTKLATQLEAMRFRNGQKEAYYEQKNLFKDLRITLPPTLRGIETALGWVAKGVDSLADRIQHQGFALPGGSPDDFGIQDIWDANRLALEAPMATTSTLIHGCSFIVSYLGDVAAGEPEVVVTVVDAKRGTGLMSPLAGMGLSAYLGVLAQDEAGQGTYYLLLTRHEAIHIKKSGYGWKTLTLPHGLGRVPVEPLIFNPRTTQRFGTSRVSRAAMGITDGAVRTLVRTEVGAEFFTMPQRWMAGASEENFKDSNGEFVPVFKILTGGVWAAPPVFKKDDETDENIPAMLPEMGQFPQVSMAPSLEHYRMHAQNMAAEMNLPISAFGVVQDNPSSAEAIYAAKEELVILSEKTIAQFSYSWSRAMQTAVQMRDNLREVPSELKRLQVLYRDPSTPSRAAAADSALKIQSIVESGNEVLMELAGMTPQQIERVMAGVRRAEARDTMNRLLSSPDEEPEVVTEVADDN